MKKFILACILTLVTAAYANPAYVRGTSLTELGNHLYEASLNDGGITEAQQIVDRLYQLGNRHIVLSPRATMLGPWTAEVEPMTPLRSRSKERRNYLNLIEYIHKKGMTVGLRPIVFVVDNDGKTPFKEVLSSGDTKAWWHGNIQPKDPRAWFESFRTYLDSYLVIAKRGEVEEFTIGAELYSMTVGIEDQWKEHPHGFPRQWAQLLSYVKTKVPANCRVMYDINFTDDRVDSPSGLAQYGGEFARWKYRLVDIPNPDPYLVEFWKGLDAIGIDMYRSLATKAQTIPVNYDDLVDLLTTSAERYATQIDTALFEIEDVVGQPQKVILKEIGYRSVDLGFIDPFVYAGTEGKPVNLSHQAAAYEAIFRAFWEPQWAWFQGIVFWDASVDLSKHGPTDTGFSVIGKAPTESVVLNYFGK